MSRPALLAVKATVGGLLYGGLLYGAPLALLHRLEHHLTSPWNGAAALGRFCLLYGAGAAVIFLLSAALAWGAARILDRSAPPTPTLTLARGVSLGIFLFNEGCWVLLPVLSQPTPGAASGIAYLGVRLLFLTAGVGAVSWLLGRLMMSLHTSGGIRYLAAALAALALLLHLGISDP